jgi:hypothetical protein
MATNFYKTGGSYYTADTNTKILNPTELQGYAQAGGKEIAAPTPIAGAVAIPNPQEIANYNVTNQIGGTLYGTPKIPTSLNVADTNKTAIVPAPPQTDQQTMDKAYSSYMGAGSDELASAIKASQNLSAQGQADISAKQADITSTIKQLGTKSDYYANQVSGLDVAGQQKQLSELNTQIQSRKAEFDKLIEATRNNPNLITSTGIGYQSQINRQSAIELGALTSMAQAVQGNITASLDTAKTATDNYFAPIENKLQLQLQQLQDNYQNFSTAEKKRADQLAQMYQKQLADISTQKEEQANIAKVMASAAQNGADNSTLKKIMDSKTQAEAIINAGKFLQTASKIEDVGGVPSVYNPQTGNYEPVKVDTTKQVGALDDNELEAVIQTMAKREGYGASDPNNIPNRNNNPLNIKVPAAGINEARIRYNDPGATIDPVPAIDGGYFIKFSNPDIGMNAAKILLQSSVYSQLSLDQALKKWSGGGYGAEILANSGINTNGSYGTVNLTTEEKAFQDDLSKALDDLAKGGDWGTNWNYMFNRYKDALEKSAKENGITVQEALDQLLRKNDFYPKEDKSWWQFWK